MESQASATSGPDILLSSLSLSNLICTCPGCVVCVLVCGVHRDYEEYTWDLIEPLSDDKLAHVVGMPNTQSRHTSATQHPRSRMPCFGVYFHRFHFGRCSPQFALTWQVLCGRFEGAKRRCTWSLSGATISPCDVVVVHVCDVWLCDLYNVEDDDVWVERRAGWEWSLAARFCCCVLAWSHRVLGRKS